MEKKITKQWIRLRRCDSFSENSRVILSSKMETRRSHASSSSKMKKSQLICKKVNEGPIYMEFKSYKVKPIPSQLDSSAKPAPLSSGETVASRDQQYADLQKELKQQKDQQTNLLRSIEKLQTENEQFKTRIATLVTPQTYQELELQLEGSIQERDALQHEIQRLFAVNQQQIGIVDDLKTQISDLQRDQHTLRDQIKLEQEAKTEQANVYDQLTKETQQLHNTIQGLTSDNQCLKNDKQQLQNRLELLQNHISEMDRKVDLLGVMQKKLKSYETQMQQTIQKNKTLAEQNDSFARFVKVLENEMKGMKSQNDDFTRQNKQLRRQLSGLKKSIERLRQKYDEVNKENKILKEKESRYMYHEKFNVGKYVHKLPSLFTNFGNETTNSTQNSNIQNYMRAAKNVKNKSTRNEAFDLRYYLLHRQENIKDNKSDSNDRRKVKK